MDDEQQNEHQALLAWILGIAVTIAVAASVVIGILAAMGSGSAGPAQAALVAAPQAGAAATGDSAAVTEVDVAPAPAAGPGYPAQVRFQFETAKFELPPDAATQLAPLAEWARGDATARIGISGFHDRHGDAAANAMLARNRAMATREALLAAGVPAERIVMVKPQVTTGSGDDREARRVDVYPAR
ncbi:MAG: OmpA family protein [Burkholderiaceae bacterium]|nr:OmpA family protein [Burkholderiaceae bacterium]